MRNCFAKTNGTDREHKNETCTHCIGRNPHYSSLVMSLKGGRNRSLLVPFLPSPHSLPPLWRIKLSLIFPDAPAKASFTPLSRTQFGMSNLSKFTIVISLTISFDDCTLNRLNYISECFEDAESERENALRCKTSEVETPPVRFVGKKAPVPSKLRLISSHFRWSREDCAYQ